MWLYLVNVLGLFNGRQAVTQLGGIVVMTDRQLLHLRRFQVLRGYMRGISLYFTYHSHYLAYGSSDATIMQCHICKYDVYTISHINQRATNIYSPTIQNIPTSSSCLISIRNEGIKRPRGQPPPHNRTMLPRLPPTRKAPRPCASPSPR